jgi:hypothetical protein
MKQLLKRGMAIIAMSTAVIATAAPTFAQPGPPHGPHGRGPDGRGPEGWGPGGRWGRGGPDHHRKGHRPPPPGRFFDYNRPDPRYHGYYANRYYQRGYDPIRVNRNTRIYRGSDDRYYCRRSDGTTGLIVGGAIGGLLGNQIARGQSNTIGTIIGAGAGALLGREIDRGGVSCR